MNKIIYLLHQMDNAYRNKKQMLVNYNKTDFFGIN